MTIWGKIFMVLFFFSVGLGVGLYLGDKNIEQLDGNKTEIVIKKIKDSDNIVIDTKQEKDKEKKKKKKFLGIF